METYIPRDALFEILINTPINDIFNACTVNKTAISICNSNFFWDRYIRGKQRRFLKVIEAAVMNGKLSLFIKLWEKDIPKGVIFDPHWIYHLFYISIVNGHRHIAEYLWTQYPRWIKRHANNKNNNFDDMEFKVMLDYYLITNQYGEIKKLVKEWSPTRWPNYLEEDMAKAYSYKLFVKVKKLFISYNFSPFKLFRRAARRGNMAILQEIIKELTLPIPLIIMDLLESWSADVLPLLTRNYPNYPERLTADMYNRCNIRNKFIFQDLMKRVKDKKLRSVIIVNSALAFESRSYLRMVNRTGFCFTPLMLTYQQEYLEDDGYYYKAKVLGDLLPLCEPKRNF